jgi:DNA-binding response OmpR family regulator
MRILYVEDSASLRELVGRALRRAGYEVDVAEDGEEGSTFALSRPYDVAILDILLPKLDGLALLKRLRGCGLNFPVLMLTARTKVSDRVAGLHQGADDYLVKPFALDELLARIYALGRRHSGLVEVDAVAGPVTLYTEAKVVTCGERAVELKPREYELLEYLVRQKGKEVSRTEIETLIYQDQVDGTSNAVNSAISILRRRLAEAGAPDLIQTRRGLGYCIPRDSAVTCIPSIDD